MVLSQGFWILSARFRVLGSGFLVLDFGGRGTSLSQQEVVERAFEKLELFYEDTGKRHWESVGEALSDYEVWTRDGEVAQNMESKFISMQVV